MIHMFLYNLSLQALFCLEEIRVIAWASHDLGGIPMRILCLWLLVHFGGKLQRIEYLIVLSLKYQNAEDLPK